MLMIQEISHITLALLFVQSYKKAIVLCQYYDVGSHDWKIDKKGYFCRAQCFSVWLCKIVQREPDWPPS